MPPDYCRCGCAKYTHMFTLNAKLDPLNLWINPWIMKELSRCINRDTNITVYLYYNADLAVLMQNFFFMVVMSRKCMGIGERLSSFYHQKQCTYTVS